MPGAVPGAVDKREQAEYGLRSCAPVPLTGVRTKEVDGGISAVQTVEMSDGIESDEVATSV